MSNYDHKKIEQKWTNVWEKTQIYRANDASKDNKLYHLVMYPYPSGDLHTGHWYNFAGADFRARFKKMQGYNVMSPIGFDSFGLPAENAAIKRGINPKKWTYDNISKMTEQLKTLGAMFDWKRTVITSDPDYYRWTQWMFLYMYKKGLAYRKKVTANWCTSCNTVLANEQVIGEGVCERCENPVIQKELEQWLFKITDYAEDLLSGLEKIDWPNRTKTMQRNWIGKSVGAEITFKIADVQRLKTKDIKVFTTRPDTIFGATFMVLAPEHELVKELIGAKNKELSIKNLKEIQKYLKKVAGKTELQRLEEGKDKEGVFSGVYAINPANGKEIPIWISDYVLMSYGHGAIMAVPAHDERDHDFAKKYKLPIIEVVAPYTVYNPNPKKETEEREVVVSIVYNPKNDTYLCLDWLKTGWKSFVSGGSDGEDLLKAAKREVLEETGYKHIKLIKQFEHSLFEEFYRPHKDSNVIAQYRYFLFELENEDKVEIPNKEQEQHKPVWIKKEKVKDFLNIEHLKDLWENILNNKDIIFTNAGVLVNSGKYNGLSSDEAKEKIVADLGKEAKKTINYKLRDWLISRQRYWGAPIPIVYCPKCGQQPIPETDLPVLLPDKVEFKPTGESPLKLDEAFVNTNCPKCGGAANRETDTMDTFVCSSWYYFRYTDPINKKEFASKEKIKKWLPVDIYVGGAEHSVLHLLYSRFFTRALKDGGYCDFDEPFSSLRHQGMILGPNGLKMSKSKGNVVDPDELVCDVGADAVRLYMGFMGPYDQGGPWNPKGLAGVRRFLERVWKLYDKYEDSEPNLAETRLLNKTIKKVGEDIEEFKFNTAISALMILVNELGKNKTQNKRTLGILALMLSPFAPFMAEELWEKLGETESVHLAPWPSYDKKYIEEDICTIVIQVNGKVRANIEMSKSSTQKQVEAEALKNENVKKFIGNIKPKKIIYIPGKILNIVI